jgi:tripartite-type tricarboxylate transporter receptor subunit TctC
MSSDAKAYYQGLFKKVFDSKEWQGYMKKKSLQGGFLSGVPLTSYWMRENAVQKDILMKMGAIK